MARGRIDYLQDAITVDGTTHWRRPWVLKVWRFGCWAVVGYYTTRSGAMAAARRQRIGI
jgi:hypothetical protein